MVETLQQPELQLVEEKIEVADELTQSELVLGVGSGVGLCITVLLVVGLWVRHAKCGQRSETSLLQEYSVGPVTGAGEDGRLCSRGGGDGGHRKSILKKQQSCDSSPDLIPHSDQESWNFCAATPRKEVMKTDMLDDSIKSSSRDGLLAHSSGCDLNVDDDDDEDGDLDHPLHIKDGLPLHNHMEDPVNVFPHKISTSTLKRGSTGSKRTFLLKEKRESIV